MKAKLARRLMQVFCIIVLAILAVNLGIYYQRGVDAAERPPLTAGLTGKSLTWVQMTAILTERVRQAHPVGSNVAALTANLAGQGFKSETWGILPGKIGRAYRDESNWVCRQGAEVRWSVDERGQLTSVNAVYEERGCL